VHDPPTRSEVKKLLLIHSCCPSSSRRDLCFWCWCWMRVPDLSLLLMHDAYSHRDLLHLPIEYPETTNIILRCTTL